jgi:acyl carrier protein
MQDGINAAEKSGQQRLLLLIDELMELAPGTLTGAEKLEDLDGWNSLALVGFIAMVDQNFQHSISPRDMRRCQTVADLAALVPGIS